MASLTERPRRLYDLSRYDRELEKALYDPQLGPHAAAVLANVGTPLAQRSLVSAASALTTPIDLRETAAAALRKAVDRHGILLTRREIQRQYDRYNQSEILDKKTQAVLGLILDTLESKLPPAKETKGPQQAEENAP